MGVLSFSQSPQFAPSSSEWLQRKVLSGARRNRSSMSPSRATAAGPGHSGTGAAQSSSGQMPWPSMSCQPASQALPFQCRR